MKGILAAACVLAGVALTGMPSHAGQWVVANAAGCKALWPVRPVPNLRAIWNGGCSGDLANGRGRLVWLQAMTEIATYEGGMFAGRYHDFGTLKDRRCTIYRGTWVLAKPQGTGVGLYLIPRERIAELDAASRPNLGRSYYFEGEWANGAPYGTGVATRPGSHYRGRFRNGLPVGNLTAIDKKAAPDFGRCFEKARVMRLF